MKIEFREKELEVLLDALEKWDDLVTEDRIYVPDLVKRIEKEMKKNENRT